MPVIFYYVYVADFPPELFYCQVFSQIFNMSYYDIYLRKIFYTALRSTVSDELVGSLNMLYHPPGLMPYE